MRDWYEKLDRNSRKYVRKLALISMAFGFVAGAVVTSSL